MHKNYDHGFRIEVEECILGAFLIDSSPNMKQIAEKHHLLPKDFADQHNRELFTAIHKMWEENRLVDIVSISDYRPDDYKQNMIGSDYKNWNYQNVTIMDRVGSSVHVEEHILKLKEFNIADYWNGVSDLISRTSFDIVSPLDISESIINGHKIIMDRYTHGIVQHKIMTYEEEQKMKFERKKLGLSTSVPTGTYVIDRAFRGGMNNGELVIIAGRPGMMKTTIAMISAWKTSKLGNKVRFYSVEMPKNQLVNKIASLETGIDYTDIKNMELTDEQFNKVLEAGKKVEESTLEIIDNISHIDVMVDDIRKNDCDIVFVDFLQLMKSAYKDPTESTSAMIREFKLIAKEAYIPVVVLSQLNRQVEGRMDKRPILADLKQSGAIEEMADIVVFPFNEAYYTNEDALAQMPNHFKYKVEWNIAKGRDIGTGNRGNLEVNPVKYTIKEYHHSF